MRAIAALAMALVVRAMPYANNNSTLSAHDKQCQSASGQAHCCASISPSEDKAALLSNFSITPEEAGSYTGYSCHPVNITQSHNGGCATDLACCQGPNKGPLVLNCEPLSQ